MKTENYVKTVLFHIQINTNNEKQIMKEKKIIRNSLNWWLTDLADLRRSVLFFLFTFSLLNMIHSTLRSNILLIGKVHARSLLFTIIFRISKQSHLEHLTFPITLISVSWKVLFILFSHSYSSDRPVTVRTDKAVNIFDRLGKTNHWEFTIATVFKNSRKKFTKSGVRVSQKNTRNLFL